MNRAQRRLHSHRRRAAVGEAPRTPGLVRGSHPIADGAGARFSVAREGFAGDVAMPQRPAGWVVLVGGAEAPDGYAALRVERPDGAWRDAVVAAVRWLSALPEARGLPIALAGHGEGREAALAAAAALGPRVSALVLDAEASGPVVLTPTLVAADEPERVAGFLAAELGAAPPCALNHRQRRLVARRLERRMRRECRRRGALTGRVRAGIATLAAALAFTLALGTVPDRAAAFVTSGWSVGTQQLTATSDGAPDGITLDCDTAAVPEPRVEVNSAIVTVTGDAGFDPGVLNCAEVGSISVDGQGGSDTIDLSAVNQTDFMNVQGNDVSLLGGGNVDSITGSQVGDLLAGGPGDDTMNGQGASDTVDYSAATDAVTLDLGAGDAMIGGETDTLTGIENAIGSDQADVLTAATAVSSMLGGLGADTVTGTNGGDTLRGGGDGDVVMGLGGVDSVFGDAGDDSLNGGPLGDSVNGGTENDTLVGGDNQVDTLDGSTGIDLVDYKTAVPGGIDLDLGGTQTVGGAESDSIAGFEQVIGSDDTDTLTGSTAADTLLGQAEADIIDGREGDDSLAGNNGADVIDGYHGNDTLMGANGLDTLRGDPDASVAGGVGNDSIDGGALDDLLVDEVRSSNDNIVITDSQASGNGVDALTSIEQASLVGDGDDNLLAASDGIQTGVGTEFTGSVTIDAGAGNDTVRGGLSDDSLDAGTETDLVQQIAPGNQTLTPTQLSGQGDDALVGVDQASLRADNSGDEFLDANTFTGPVTLFGGIGDNTLRGGTGDDSFRETGSATDSVVGNTGADTIDYAGIAGPVDVDLAVGEGNKGGPADTLESVEHAIGTAANDTFVGDSLPNQLQGEGGDDTLQGGPNDDTLDGGAGTNTADYSDDPGGPGVGIDADLSANQVQNASIDSLAGIQNLVGTSAADTLNGDGASNVLEGAGGDDTVTGGAGTDTLRGGTENDVLNSQDGGVVDRNECGGDAGDVANADAQDVNVDCATVNAGGGGGGGGGGGNPPPPPGPPADTTPPTLTLSGKGKQKSKKVKVDATVDEASSVEVGGTVKVPKTKKKSRRASTAKNKTYDLPVASAEIAAGATETLVLKATGKAKKALGKALKQGRKSTASLTATAADAAGNQGADEFKVKVKKKRKK